MSPRLFLGLLPSLLFLWLCAGVFTTIVANGLVVSFQPDRLLAALLHGFFISAILLTLWFGRATVGRFKIVIVLTLSLFCGLLYFSGAWSSMLAAFARAPWATENERGPAMSAPSDYSIYTWEWEVGPRGVRNRASESS